VRRDSIPTPARGNEKTATLVRRDGIPTPARGNEKIIKELNNLILTNLNLV